MIVREPTAGEALNGTVTYGASVLRVGSPDFLDLPWDLPLAEWPGRIEREEQVPRGASRHPVIFVNYGGAIYALKELPARLAETEYSNLLKMEEMRLPVVSAVGHMQVKRAGEDVSVLATRYLDRSLPYQTLFATSEIQKSRDLILDAMAGLLVQLHIAGVFWGDCSLANTLFRRDVGSLQAYLVDAETAELQPSLSAGMRDHDLDIMEENVAGALLDLAAMRGEQIDDDPGEVGSYIRSRYTSLWEEVTREEAVAAGESWKIQQRIHALNQLGFTVREISLLGAEGSSSLQFKAMVADRHYHADLLHSLTGIEAEERQAQLLLNEIQEMRLRLSDTHDRSVPLSAASFNWQTILFDPISKQLSEQMEFGLSQVEAYCALLEHKWYLSEAAAQDVGHDAAVADLLGRSRSAK